MDLLLDYSVFPQRSHFWKHTSSPDTNAKNFKTDVGERKARVAALKRTLKIKIVHTIKKKKNQNSPEIANWWPSGSRFKSFIEIWFTYLKIHLTHSIF